MVQGGLDFIALEIRKVKTVIMNDVIYGWPLSWDGDWIKQLLKRAYVIYGTRREALD